MNWFNYQMVKIGNRYSIRKGWIFYKYLSIYGNWLNYHSQNTQYDLDVAIILWHECKGGEIVDIDKYLAGFSYKDKKDC